MDTSITHPVSDSTIESIFSSDARGCSAEYWAQQFNIATWALGESDRLHKEQIAAKDADIVRLQSELNKAHAVIADLMTEAE